MDATFKVSPADLMNLTERIKNASEDLQMSTVEIQYLLSQFNAAVSGKDMQKMTDTAMGDIDHCKQLCATLDEISGFLKTASSEYLAEESKIVARLQGLQVGRVFS